MRDLICDIISYWASSFAMRKWRVYDQIAIKNLKKEYTDVKQIVTWIFIYKDDYEWNS